MVGFVSPLYVRPLQIEHMSPAQQANLEESVDAICDSLVWSWRYYYALEGLHEGSKANGDRLQPVGAFLLCVWTGMFEALLAKASQVIDSTKNVHSFYYLFKKTRSYITDDDELKKIVNDDESLLKGKVPERILNWRNNRISHLSSHGRNDDFFSQNHMQLTEIQDFLKLCEEMLNRYANRLLGMVINTESGGYGLQMEGLQLLSPRPAEQFLPGDSEKAALFLRP